MLRGRILSIVQAVRPMSKYAPAFRDPIPSLQRLEELQKTGEGKTLATVPIKAARSEVSTSPLYDPLLEKFVNFVMRCGKKELARTQVNKTLETIKRIQVEKYNSAKTEEEKAAINVDALNILHQAIENCKPLLQLKPIKRGGATYQVPVSITANRAQFMSINWLIEQGKAEPRTQRFYVKMANELISASEGTGRVIKRKQELHKQCEANRAYAHYRWG
uniref:28S ribosomal protein S7, mitochondrial n=1 Tax=Lygus hesperus TaxID=30085 RepID=A0A0A9YH61_LYGHE